MALATLKREGPLFGASAGFSPTLGSGGGTVQKRVSHLKDAWAGGTALLGAWMERARQRHHLAALDDRMLSDIGLSRTQAEVEFRKPFWRA